MRLALPLQLVWVRPKSMSKATKPSPAEAGKTIHVRGAREHNLKNVDL